MRPQSIIMFERLFLASLALGAVNFVLSYEQAAAVLANDTGARQFGLGSGFLIGMTVVSFAVYLLLWFLVARKASHAAKWTRVVLVTIGVLFAPAALTGPWDRTLVLSLLVHGLEVAALVQLFRPDAKAWLAGKEQSDPTTFD